MLLLACCPAATATATQHQQQQQHQRACSNNIEVFAMTSI